jgi:hypothetical protein
MSGGEVLKGEGKGAEATMAFRWCCVLFLTVGTVAVERSGSSAWSAAATGLVSWALRPVCIFSLAIKTSSILA